MIVKIKEITPVLEALQFDGTNIEEVKNFITDDYEFDNRYLTKKNDYRVRVDKGEYIVKDVDGSIILIPKCTIDINYELIEEVLEE